MKQVTIIAWLGCFAVGTSIGVWGNFLSPDTSFAATINSHAPMSRSLPCVHEKVKDRFGRVKSQETKIHYQHGETHWGEYRMSVNCYRCKTDPKCNIFRQPGEMARQQYQCNNRNWQLTGVTEVKPYIKRYIINSH